MTDRQSQEIVSLIKLWEDRAAEIRILAHLGSGDAFRSYRQSELEVLEDCIEELTALAWRLGVRVIAIKEE